VDRLHAIAVVDIEIHVQDPQPVTPCPGDRQRWVVVDAESGRVVGHRMMQPAARVEGMLDIAAQDGFDRPQRSTGHHRPGFVHASERRIVAAFADPGVSEPERVGREPLDGLDVSPRVDPQELVVGGGLGRQTRLGADRPQQLDPRSEPPWRQWMARSEVVGRGSRAVHEQHGMAR